jgi:hypothetical protein
MYKHPTEVKLYRKVAGNLAKHEIQKQERNLLLVELSHEAGFKANIKKCCPL